MEILLTISHLLPISKPNENKNFSTNSLQTSMLIPPLNVEKNWREKAGNLMNYLCYKRSKNNS